METPEKIKAGGTEFTVLFPDLIRPLTAEESHDLRESIIEDGGIRVPVLVDENGGIIDGTNRVRFAAELGIDVPVRVLPGLDDETKRRVAVSANIARRQMTAEEVQAARQDRKRRVLELRAEGMSTRDIAAEVGVSQSQVVADLKDSIEQGCSMPDRITTSDGRTYPAKREEKEDDTSPEDDLTNEPVADGESEADRDARIEAAIAETWRDYEKICEENPVEIDEPLPEDIKPVRVRTPREANIQILRARRELRIFWARFGALFDKKQPITRAFESLLKIVRP